MAADGPKKILIVDDEPAVLDVLREFFERSPELYAVQTASNGEEAVASVRRDVPNLVLLDVDMPQMDGVTALRQILSIDRSIAVMMITGNAAAAPAEALRLGAFAYFPKPVDFTYLEQLVPLALQRRRTPTVRPDNTG